MRRDEPGQLRMALPGQPVGRAVAMGEGPGRIVGRAGSCRRRGAGPRPRPAARSTAMPALVDPRRQPAGDLGHRARVRHEPGWGIEGEQQGSGRYPAGTVIGPMVPDGRGPAAGGPVGGRRRAGRGGRPAASGRGATNVSGIAHRNRATAGAPAAGVVGRRGPATRRLRPGSPSPAASGSVRTVSPPGSKATVTVPSRSVR